MRRRITLGLTGLVLSLALVACGSDSKEPAATGDSSSTVSDFPVTIHNAAGDVTFDKAPSRIVSMTATATENLFAMGAGPQVIAVDQYSNYPPGVPKGDLDAYQANAEAIAAKQPDLVVLSDDRNGVVKGLAALKIPVLIESAAAKLEEMYAEIAELGKATGHVAGAAKVVKTVKSGIAKVVANTKAEGVSYYYELETSLYSQTSKTFLGQLLKQVRDDLRP